LYLKPKKRFGQHFLKDFSIVNSITEAAGITKEDIILEIGGGHGILTERLALSGCKLISLEIDRKLSEKLKNKFSSDRNVEIINCDVLNFNFNSLSACNKKIKVVANLPYNISTQVVFKILKNKAFFSTLILMFQKEVALRLSAKPSTKSYGSLSVLSQLYFDSELLFIIPPKAFFPPPKVQSAVVKITVNEKPKVDVGDEEIFKKIIKNSFLYRRKTLKNSVKSIKDEKLKYVLSESLEEIKFDISRRIETFSLSELGFLSLTVSKKLLNKEN